MGAPPTDDQLISVHEFANRYRVDVAVVRGWVKRGHIPYVLVGPRKMLRVGDIPKLVKPIQPTGPVRERLVTLFREQMEMDLATAQAVVETMTLDDVYAQTIKMEASDGAQEQGREDNSPRPASTRKGTASNRRNRTPPRRVR